MSPAQVKLFAIRARISGVWDHPALVHFGEPPCSAHSISYAIGSILDADVSLADAAKIEQELDGLEEGAECVGPRPESWRFRVCRAAGANGEGLDKPAPPKHAGAPKP